MNKLKEEFLKFLDYEMPVSTDKQLFSIDKNGIERLYDWINQNYISKEEILNLECLKEEKITTLDIKYDNDNPEIRNQLREEIKEEITKDLFKDFKQVSNPLDEDYE